MMEGEIRSSFSREEHKRALAKKLHMEIFEDLSAIAPPMEILKKVPYAFVRKHRVLPVSCIEGVVKVATTDPLSLEPMEELRHMLKEPVEAVWAPQEILLQAIGECYDAQTGAASELILSMRSRKNGEEEGSEVYDLLETSKTEAPIVKLLNLILKEAIQQGASDIHFEPSESGMRIRYRIDGVLQPRHAPAQASKGQLITRIKVIAKLDIAEHRLPQDGRIRLRMGRKEIDFRVSTMPTGVGERVVLRILDKSSGIVPLTGVGFLPESLALFEEMITHPEGIVLVTGPTGSGKTTTLYSTLNALYDDRINIMTIEDPVEYRLKGIAQIGVRPNINLTFAAGLRHILRQDPDVIMVGEIRDVETAQIAIQSALTGHLVLSTLHTNDAPSAVTRLVDMGIEPYLLSSTLVGCLAQRLVRKICSECKIAITPTEKEREAFNLHDNQIFEGKGCAACYGSGYRGRCGIYELMAINDPIKQQFLKSPDSSALRKVAIQEGMMTLFAHGRLLVLEGVTTLSEVLRVTRGMG